MLSWLEKYCKLLKHPLSVKDKINAIILMKCIYFETQCRQYPLVNENVKKNKSSPKVNHFYVLYEAMKSNTIL